MKPKHKIIGSIVFFLCLYGVNLIYKVDKNELLEIDRCNWELKMKNKIYEGLVIEKFIDQKNHNKQTITLKKENRKFNITWTNELSGFYSKIENGDYLIKEKKELKVTLIRQDNTSIHKIDYGCNKN